MSYKSIHYYKLMITCSKYLLLFGIVTIICALIFYSNINNKRNKISNNDVSYYSSTLSNTEKAKSYLLKPKFYGVNNENHPYSIKASEGVQQQEHYFLLKGIYADFFDDKNYISMVGNNAYITTDKNILEVEGDVNIGYDDSYILSSDFVTIDYKNNSATGHGKVFLKSDTGTIGSEQFEVLDNYNEVKFYGGRVKTILNPGAKFNNRPLRKPAPERQVQGVYEAQNRSVLDVHEDSSIGTTQQLSAGVEFPKRSNE